MRKPLLVSTGDERRGRAAAHDERVAAGTRPARQESAVKAVLQERSGKIVEHAGIGCPPQYIEIPHGKPERIAVVHVESGLSVLQHRQPAHREAGILQVIALLRSALCIVGIGSVDVVYLMASQQHMP